MSPPNKPQVSFSWVRDYLPDSISAAPFDDRWYGAHLMCLIPFIFINKAHSAEMNYGPLSETNCSGRPYAAKISLSSMMVLCAVVVAILTTSGHFECVLKIIKKVFPIKGPAKSISIIC